MKICIDPGHGGKDPGAIDGTIKEKDIALKISTYQYKRFKELGFEPFLTRYADTTLAANTRTNLVKDGGAKLCISNHLNSGGGEGAEIIYGVQSNSRLASSILYGLKAEGMPIRKAFTKSSSKGKNIDYYFMHRNTKPVETVIVEYGFLDNSKDRKLILENWERYAEAVVKAVCIYAGMKYTPARDEELIKALEKLKAEGIISTSNYWVENAVSGGMIKGEFAATMIKNFANKL